jgi:putative acetyltransferase
MIKLIRTNSKSNDFINLVKLLDADLKIKDGEDHAFYNQFNNIKSINHAVVLYINNKAVGCGALKKYNENTSEIKRMYTRTEARGKGIASKILQELEHWSKELSFNRCILETGRKQPDAIALYKKCNYKITSNYGQFKNVTNSVCFEKLLNQ